MTEKVILVDKNDKEVGSMEKQEAHRNGKSYDRSCRTSWSLSKGHRWR